MSSRDLVLLVTMGVGAGAFGLLVYGVLQWRTNGRTTSPLMGAFEVGLVAAGGLAALLLLADALR